MKRKITFILILLAVLSFNTQSVFAWDNTTNHPALTSESVNFYNLNSENKLTAEEKELIIQGSIDEDIIPRWVNHFWDPVYDEGWTGELAPNKSWYNIVQKYPDLLSPAEAVSAPKWSVNQKLQAKYSLYKGNHTWQKAIYEYVKGNKEEALYSLGYVLHLIQDMAVPEHTRNDTHPGDSPLENFCAKNYNINNFHIVNDLQNQNFEPIIFDNLDEYFKYLAFYSNNYFFSKDTINIEKYDLPKIVKDDGNFAYGHNKDNKEFILATVDYKKVGEYEFTKIYNIEGTKEYHPILQSYWTHLSREAVLASSGAIDLFFKEVEKAKQNPELLQEPPKEKTAIVAFITGDFSPIAEGLRTVKAAKNITTSVAKAIYNAIKWLLGFLSGSEIDEITKDVLSTGGSMALLSASDEINSFVDASEDINSNQEQEEWSILAQAEEGAGSTDSGTFATNSENSSSAPASEGAEETSTQQDDQASGDSAAPESETSEQEGYTNPGVSTLIPIPSPAIGGGGSGGGGGSSSQTNNDNGGSAEDNGSDTGSSDDGSGDGSGDTGTGDDGSDDGSSDDGSNDGTGDDGSSDDGSGDTGTGDDGSDDGSSDDGSNDGTGDDGSSDDGSGDTGTGDDGSDDGSGENDNPIVLDMPQILSPTAEELSQTFTDNIITFSGTSTLSSTGTSTITIGATYSLNGTTTTATTTVDSNGDWSLELTLDQGTTTIQFFIMDEDGNTSNSIEIVVFVDSLGPDVTLEVAECNDSLSQDFCLTTSTTLNVSWSLTGDDEDFDYFTINQNGVISVPASTSTTQSTTITITMAEDIDETYYSFSVYATDTLGNDSIVSTQDIIIVKTPVVINEVAWAGTATSSSDEWIELFNRTDYDIDFSNSNWILYSQTDQTPYIELTGQIPANGYYLIERTDDNTVSDIPADWIGSFGTGLNNNGEVLALSYASSTIDQNSLCGSSNKWCPSYDYKYKSMERVSADRSGTDQSNWKPNNGFIINGKDANGDPILGTPKARNSAASIITGNITEDTTLTKANSPYLVKDEIIIIEHNASLTIEPGVVIKFDNAGFDVFGKITSQGVKSDPIVFTSYHDDEYGGDFNNNGTSTMPAAGDWFGIVINDTAHASSIFNYSIFRYGGKYYTTSYDRAMLVCEGTIMSVFNSTFEYSKLNAIRLTNSNSQISNSTFNNNNVEVGQANAALYIIDSIASIQSNTFTGNRRGIYLSNSPSILMGNSFNSNTEGAIYSYGELGKFGANSGTNNGLNAINIHGNLTSEGDNKSLVANPLPYNLVDLENSFVAASSTLTIESGVIIKGNEKSLYVDGNLVINGENPEDIIFTSLYDDTEGGDTNNDGASTTPALGQFAGIKINENGSLNARGFTMKYAGANIFGEGTAAGIYINNAIGYMANALFDSNYSHAIKAENSENITVENAQFRNHTTQAAIAIYNSTVELVGEIIFENNILCISSDDLSDFLTVGISTLTWENNDATTTPEGLF